MKMFTAKFPFHVRTKKKRNKKNIVINLFNIITLSALMILISESTESLFQFSITFQFVIHLLQNKCLYVSNEWIA